MWPFPRILAHRGGGTLAPENTVAALRCGVAHGYRAVEFDVMLSGDGVGVVIHDNEFGRTVPGQGSVDRTSAAELAKMDAGVWFGPAFAGEPVPRFDEFADFCRAQGIWMNIEIKPAPGSEAATGRWVARATRARFRAELEAGDIGALPLLSSFSPEALAAARDAAPELPRGYLLEQIPDDWLAQARALDVCAIHTDHACLTPALAQSIKSAGFGLFCYTVNDAARARQILDWGVDAFCTDRIDLIGSHFGAPQSG